jgi:hypothetical protein
VRLLVVGAVLLLAGFVSWALYAVQSGKEAHSFTSGGAPPAYVQVTPGHTYRIGIDGGVKHEAELGVQPSTLQCTAAAPGQAPGALPVTAEQNGTKAVNQIGSFVATFSGQVHIACDRVGPVYVDNASDAGYDWSGFWLVLASLGLVIGFPLTLSALRGVLTNRPTVGAVPAPEGC